MNERTATLLGVNPDFVYFQTFFISGALAGAAGVLIGIAFNAVHFLMGEPYMLRAFVVIVLGGLGSIMGALVAGLLLGMVQTLTIAYMSSGLSDAIIFSLLFVTLLLRPPDFSGRCARKNGWRANDTRSGSRDMTDFVAGYLPLFNLVILNCGLALSQYVGVARRRVLGGDCRAGLDRRLHGRHSHPELWHADVARRCPRAAMGMLAALILSLPLARLRGVFQAIATVAMVQIILSLAPLCRRHYRRRQRPQRHSAAGRHARTVVVHRRLHLLAVFSLGRGRSRPAFDAIRQDETVAVSLGIAVARYQALAFALSGAIAGATGALMACHNHSVVPEEFGFDML